MTTRSFSKITPEIIELSKLSQKASAPLGWSTFTLWQRSTTSTSDWSKHNEQTIAMVNYPRLCQQQVLIFFVPTLS